MEKEKCNTTIWRMTLLGGLEKRRNFNCSLWDCWGSGETNEIKLSLLRNGETETESLAREQLVNGYEELDEERLMEFVVQYPYNMK